MLAKHKVGGSKPLTRSIWQSYRIKATWVAVHVFEEEPNHAYD